MKFDIPVPCFFGNMNFCDAVVRISQLGFSAVETYDWKSLPLEQVKYTCLNNNIELISICTSFFNMTDPELRAEWLNGLNESCEAAKILGVKKLITQVGNDTGKERAFQHESIVNALIQAKPILEKFGNTIMIEPLNTLFDHKGYYLWSAHEAFDIIREVNSPFVKVVYDIYHQQVSEGNIIPSITDNLDCIAHLHCAGHPGRHELQSGENDYHVIFEAVDRAGYNGYCGLEYNPIMQPEESLKQFRSIYKKEIS